MIESNTNKLTWVAICVGLVATLGLGAMSLFPNAIEYIQKPLNIKTDYFLEKPYNKSNNKTPEFLKNIDYNDNFDYFVFPTRNDTESIGSSSKTWTVVDFDFIIDNQTNAENMAFIDINNTYDNNPNWQNNDSDDIQNRVITWTDSKGVPLPNQKDSAIGNGGYTIGNVSGLKNNTTYHLQYAYYNNKNIKIYQKADKGYKHTDRFGIRPLNNTTDGSKIKFKIINYKIYNKE